MIIKMTINKDNDFTSVIERYFEDYGPWYAFNYSTFDEAGKFKKLADRYDDITRDEKAKLKPKLELIIVKSFEKYINDIKPNSRWRTVGYDAEELQSNKEYIIGNAEVEIVDNIPDKYENGETVYYISKTDKYITL